MGTSDDGKSSSSSLVVGIVVVIVLAILGGLYFWGARLEKTAPVDESDAAMVPPELPVGVPTQEDESVPPADDSMSTGDSTSTETSGDASMMDASSDAAAGAQAELQVR